MVAFKSALLLSKTSQLVLKLTFYSGYTYFILIYNKRVFFFYESQSELPLLYQAIRTSVSNKVIMPNVIFLAHCLFMVQEGLTTCFQTADMQC